jgi:hypothetical protein
MRWYFCSAGRTLFLRLKKPPPPTPWIRSSYILLITAPRWRDKDLFEVVLSLAPRLNVSLLVSSLSLFTILCLSLDADLLLMVRFYVFLTAPLYFLLLSLCKASYNSMQLSWDTT